MPRFLSLTSARCGAKRSTALSELHAQMSSLFPFGLKAGTLVDAPLKEVQSCLVHWASGNPANRDIRTREVRCSLLKSLAFLEPRFFTPDRGLLVPHGSGWTAFFDNHSCQFAPAA